ncbi:hypothetical protein FNYG_09910 [Fusarium nygamai]|uniref:Major facilitator superfamily (MFS) profile domain-containing protein n=1 Tax=Gibberella nygamai TaxID=42673 RepID=A0A2K0W2J9_GIBNY|nr:hypothetical protein FNYG_09910 [Fusarium nygamai]
MISRAIGIPPTQKYGYPSSHQVHQAELFPNCGWDTHHHIFEPSTFSYSPTRHLTPPAATVQSFKTFRQKLGITTEIPALRLRDASQRTASMVNVVANFLVSFSIPYMLYSQYAGLGSKVGFVFAGILALAIVFVVFCVPECKGKSLEQVDRMFNEGIALRKFGNYKPEDLTGDV